MLVVQLSKFDKVSQWTKRRFSCSSCSHSSDRNLQYLSTENSLDSRLFDAPFIKWHRECTYSRIVHTARTYAQRKTVPRLSVRTANDDAMWRCPMTLLRIHRTATTSTMNTNENENSKSFISIKNTINTFVTDCLEWGERFGCRPILPIDDDNTKIEMQPQIWFYCRSHGNSRPCGSCSCSTHSAHSQQTKNTYTFV